jgi:cytoskeleton protein RodZ
VDGPSHITLRAIQDCWIMVRDSDGAQTVVAQRTLHAGDSYRVPDRSGLLLRTGNAAGLEVLVDGKVAPVLGGTVRNVALDPTRLLGGTARLE